MSKAKDISEIISDANFGGTLDVDGTTNLDAVDIDGAVQMGASDDDVRMTLQGNNQYRLALKNAANALVYLGSGGANNFRISNNLAYGTLLELTSASNILLPTASAGIYLGVTSEATSNLLDDYEEGTFTPTWDGYTPYGTSGKYVKIGTQVTVYATLVTDVASDSSLIQINNLPFQISGNQGGGFVYHNSIPLYAFNIYTLFTSNSTICQLKTVSGGAEVGVKYLGSDPSMRGYSTMHWTIVYQTT